MEDRIYRIIADVCGVPIESIDENSSPDTITTWDSASHIHLILAIESEFSVELSPDDVTEMLSVKLILIILSDLGVSTAN